MIGLPSLTVYLGAVHQLQFPPLGMIGKFLTIAGNIPPVASYMCNAQHASQLLQYMQLHCGTCYVYHAHTNTYSIKYCRLRKH